MTRDQLQRFGKLNRQLAALAATIETAAGSKADEALGELKLGLVRRLVADLDSFLDEELQPFPGLAELGESTTCGDAVAVLGQYRACLDEFKARNTHKHYGRDSWVVIVNKKVEHVPVEEPPGS